jgi:outer membrane protein assembly factor BamA
MNFFQRQILRAVLILILCRAFAPVFAQETTPAKSNFALLIHPVGKDSSFQTALALLQTQFNNQPDAYTYVSKIPALLASKGYPVASVDSSWQDDQGLHINLYSGRKFNWVSLRATNVEPLALESAGFSDKNFTNKPLNLLQLQLLQQRLLDFYDKNGYPFASVFLDSVTVENDQFKANLLADKGVLYHIDSIRVYGKTKINKKFLQHYLNINNGSIYNKEKLAQVDKRMLELPYLNPLQGSDITMLGSGSVLNLYVEPKRSSQVNFIVGFLPAANQTGKLQVTGDVNLDLKNLFGTGESMLLKWQQLQPKSPRLNLGYDQPYIFNSAFGFNFLFDLFKKDSSFLQVNAQVGLQFNLANNQSGKLFLQLQNASLLEGSIDTNAIKAQRSLPPNVDVSAKNVGLNYEWLNTNYRFNPRRGNEINLITVVGIKKIKKSNEILGIKDPGFNYASLYDSIKLKSYQLRIRGTVAHYISLGKGGVFKTAVNAGYYSSPNIFRNELYQIGGYKLLRGFDEESIYATQYAVFTAEYRYLIGLNSYLFTFADIAAAKNKYQDLNVNNQFTGAGVGILFETKAGLLNLSFAVGKRNDVKFNLRESSKIHFGYINYF